jgi:hypothetical protein
MRGRGLRQLHGTAGVPGRPWAGLRAARREGRRRRGSRSAHSASASRPAADPPVDPLACPLLFASLAQLADGRGQKIDAPALLIFRRLQFGNGTGLLRDLLIQGGDPRSWPALSASSSPTRFCSTSRRKRWHRRRDRRRRHYIHRPAQAQLRRAPPLDDRNRPAHGWFLQRHCPGRNRRRPQPGALDAAPPSALLRSAAAPPVPAPLACQIPARRFRPPNAARPRHRPLAPARRQCM